MREKFGDVLEAGRQRGGEFWSDPGDRMGVFFIEGPFHKTLTIIASSGCDWAEQGLPGEPWEHVSVSTPQRCPNWPEMVFIKDLFWANEECVIQFHPPRSQYVNDHPYVLHMWKPPYPVVLPPLVTV